MTPKQIERICKFPENVVPNKDIMVEFILHWKNDVGGSGMIHTNGITDIYSYYEMAKEYYQQLLSEPKAKAMWLDVSDLKLDRFE